jgi:hypothetical protein
MAAFYRAALRFAKESRQRTELCAPVSDDETRSARASQLPDRS